MGLGNFHCLKLAHLEASFLHQFCLAWHSKVLYSFFPGFFFGFFLVAWFIPELRSVDLDPFVFSFFGTTAVSVLLVFSLVPT